MLYLAEDVKGPELGDAYGNLGISQVFASELLCELLLQFFFREARRLYGASQWE
jgi:hypothetical protein